MALLEISGLRLVFPMAGGREAVALDGIDLEVERGAVLGLVGESGCGKSMLALAIMRLVPPPGRIVAGTVRFEDRDLLALPERAMRSVRGARIGMVFQEPSTALDPVLTVGSQVAEAVVLHRRVSRREAWDRAGALLAEVGIPDPVRRLRSYPHELSGGMRQRVVIAMAIACEPALLIADEPTTALDVTIQAEILDLLRRLRERRGMATILISHDLGLVAEEAGEVAIMYAGRLVERAAVGRLFAAPRHPYTAALLRSVPVLGRRRERLDAIPGRVPPLTGRPSGCAFRDRCAVAEGRCAEEIPVLREIDAGHRVACLRA